ncbi:MAG: helix-turn-helix transcriptional regulator, partial [Microcoleaceae cyanobacterium]
GKEINKLRRKRGLSQRELAKMSGISPTYLSKLENGKSGYFPSNEVVKILAMRLRVNESELIIFIDKIHKETYDNFIDLLKLYPEMLELMKRMLEDSRFAEEILAQVDMKYML